MNSADNGSPVLSVNGVSKRFGGTQAANNLSLELYPGEVLALAGDNGAGKSTLIKMISGVYQPDSGEIKYQGETISNRSPRDVRDLGIETIYQDLALADNLDVGINIFLGRESMKSVFGLPVLDRKFMRREATGALKHLGIELNNMAMPVRYLSGGQRQAIAISRAVYWKARVLIMDEPTAALGVPEQREVKDLIKRLQNDGVAILFISHNLTDIFEVSDRIYVLERGRKAGERLISDTDEDEVVAMMMGRILDD
ncbi:ABC transporter ATP-binding protein [Chromatiales bacterium (ex Bugula neritina AB1)]|nr:ABC transporter ATP-binding protein [Chromatiales bacterium (ex Bugula neritina AB1)]